MSESLRLESDLCMELLRRDLIVHGTSMVSQSFPAAVATEDAFHTEGKLGPR